MTNTPATEITTAVTAVKSATLSFTQKYAYWFMLGTFVLGAVLSKVVLG